MDSDEEVEKKPSDFKVFVDSVDGYIGSAIANALAVKGYQVFGFGSSSPNQSIKMLKSRKEGILTTDLSVFEMLESTEAFEEALEILNKNPLHQKTKIACFTPLLTWGGRNLQTEEEEKRESARPNEEEEGEEREEVDKEPSELVTEDDYLNRIPHHLVQKQYICENRALQLNEENDRLDIFLFAIGLVYGLGDNVLFKFLRQLWEFKEDAFPSSSAHISCVHVENLSAVVIKLLTLQEEEEQKKRYYIISEPSCPTLRQIGKAFSNVLSDGKTRELPSDISELHYAILTTELASESSFLGDLEDLVCAEGILECAAKIVDQFRTKFNLDPLKVLVIGPPFSYFEKVAVDIAKEIDVPFIDPYTLVDNYKSQPGDFGEEIRGLLEESEQKVNDEIIVKCTHNRMSTRDCRNKGWVISGFADNDERAGLLFNEQDPDEVTSPHFAHIPTHVVILDATDEELRLKAAEKISDKEWFEKQLKRYRKGEKPGIDPVEGEDPSSIFEFKDIFGFYDDRNVPVLVVPAFGPKDFQSFLGGRRDFGRPQEEIDAEIAEKKRIEKEIQDEKERILKENLDKEKKEWDDGESIFEAAVKKIEKEDFEFLTEKSKVLEEYLDTALMDHVIDGLFEIAKTKPANPIDALAQFLFKRNRQLK